MCCHNVAQIVRSYKICRKAASKLFHRRGPATAKLLSARVVRVRGTASVLWADEWRVLRDELNVGR